MPRMPRMPRSCTGNVHLICLALRCRDGRDALRRDAGIFTDACTWDLHLCPHDFSESKAAADTCEKPIGVACLDAVASRSAAGMSQSSASRHRIAESSIVNLGGEKCKMAALLRIFLLCTFYLSLSLSLFCSPSYHSPFPPTLAFSPGTTYISSTPLKRSAL